MEANMRALIPLFLSLIGAPAAFADTALIIANQRYDDAQNLRYADEMADLATPLRDAGFDVIVVENGSVADMRNGLSALLAAEEEDRVLIAVAGHVVRCRDGGWVLGRDASAPDLGTVGGQGVALSVLMEIASRASGRAIVLLGQEPRAMDLGAGLARGLGAIHAPQGVSVLSGAPDDLADFARRSILSPGADLAEAVGNSRSVRSHGFLSSAVPFVPAPLTGVTPMPVGPSPEEQSLWNAVAELNTTGAYRAYLEQYPQGAYRAEAQARIAALDVPEPDPLELAEAAEAALGLSRADRQQIQRDLTILDFDTRGIDGIFGRGTRAAISAWQDAARYEVTGFLTGAQIRDLRQAAALRSAELEEEDRRRREAEERADRAFWQATGQGASESGMRTYLERFPDGLFSDLAQARLDDIEAARRAEAEGQERADWDAVRAADTANAYRQYLAGYPDGLFVDIARARITELESGLPPDVIAQAEAREAALNLNEVTRRLVEQRLAATGLDPGPVDGVFTTRTREAIRRYQAARGVQATGYLDQATVVRLLAEAIGGRIIQ